MQTYDTVRQAALAALAQAVPLANQNRWEYGGFIMQVGERFSYSAPFTSRQEDKVRMTEPLLSLLRLPESPDGIALSDIPLLKKAGIVSSYHVHLSDQEKTDPTVFSYDDIKSMVMLGFATTYIAVGGTGEVYEATRDTDRMALVYPNYPPDVKTEMEEMLFRIFVSIRFPEAIGAEGPLIGNIRDVEERQHAA